MLFLGVRRDRLTPALMEFLKQRGFEAMFVTLANGGFESGDLTGWSAEGEAFRSQPVRCDELPEPARRHALGFAGAYTVHSAAAPMETDAAPRGLQEDRTGALTSDGFSVDRKYLTFVVGGGNLADVSVQLWIDGRPVREARGNGSEAMRRVAWSLVEWRGKQGQIRIVDDATGPSGHIIADHFGFSNFFTRDYE